MSLKKVKLKLNTGAGNGTGIGAAQSPATPATATPGGSRPKLKFTTKSTPSTPKTAGEEPKPKKSKAGRASKPSAKLAESKKREREESEDEQTTGSTIVVQAPLPKKVKLSISGAKTPKTPVPQTPINVNGGFKVKAKGKPKPRIPGDGYDSEASDHEIDPMEEEEYILRLLPGDDCDYLRQMIIDKKIGMPISAGGPDIQMKFFGPDARRAAITIRGRCYAAILVDLPCIIEGMKSWDKRGWWKSADICQMLWVVAPIKKEEEAKTFPLPKEVDPKSFAYPHGITPPMHFARKRRFRKRVSRTAIEAVERTVQRLLDDDANAESTKWEMIDENAERRSQMYSPAPGSSPGGDNDEDEYSEDEDAEGEDDDTSQQPGYFNTIHHNEEEEEEDDDALIAEMEAELEAGKMEASTPMSTTAATPLPSGENVAPVPEEEEDSGDESIEGDDDDDDDDEEEMDEEEKARLLEIDGVKEDIADLEKKIENAQAQIATQQNPILKRRLEDNARKLKAELQIKKSSIGEGDEY